MRATSKRKTQLNVCVSAGEMRELRKRAKRTAGGNVSAMVRGVLFPAESNVVTMALDRLLVHGVREEVPAMPTEQPDDDDEDEECDACGWKLVDGECLNTDCPQVDREQAQRTQAIQEQWEVSCE